MRRSGTILDTRKGHHRCTVRASACHSRSCARNGSLGGRSQSCRRRRACARYQSLQQFMRAGIVILALLVTFLPPALMLAFLVPALLAAALVVVGSLEGCF